MGIFIENPSPIEDYLSFVTATHSGFTFKEAYSQSFNIGTSKAVSGAYIKLVGNSVSASIAGTLDCHLFAADGNLKPTGSALASCSLNANTLSLGTHNVDFLFSSPVILGAGSYCVVLSPFNLSLPPEGDSITLVMPLNIGKFAGGKYYSSADGSTWATIAGVADILFGVYEYALPTEVSGAVTIPAIGGNVTLTQDMVVTSSGDLTLEIAKLDELVGSSIIHVQAGGKVKLTNGQQITVLSGSLYDLLC